MNLAIETIETVTGGGPRDALSIRCKDATGRINSVELSAKAQNSLLHSLLATPPAADQSKPPRYFEPKGLKLMATSKGRVGLVLYLTPTVAVHFALEKELADALKERLESLEWTGQTKQ